MITVQSIPPDEISVLRPIGEQFFRAVEFPGGAFNPDIWEAHWAQLAHAGVALAAFDEGGALLGGLCGVLQPFIYTGAPVASELFWYVLPEHRRSGAGPVLLKAFEAWAKAQGAEHVCMVALHDSMFEGVTRLYSRAGYRPMELYFRKDVG